MLRDGRLKAFTAACGPWVYRGNLLPEFYGNVFVAEPAAHVVRRTTVTSEGGTIHGRNAYQQAEFIASTDERFRPVSFATGPDGALYVVDLYRGVLQHRIALTSYLRKQAEDRKLDQPLHLGRIYRVIPAGDPPPRATRLAPMVNRDLVERLGYPNSWWRETAQRLLVEHRDPSVIPALREAVRGGMNSLGRLHALWTLQGMAALDLSSAQRALADVSPLVRTAALRAGETLLSGGDRAAFRKVVLSLLDDPVPEVQLQAVLTAGEFREPAVDFAVAGVVRDQPENAYLADALYSGIADREIVLLERILKDAAWSSNDARADRIVAGVARGAYGTRQPEQLGRLLGLAVAQLDAAPNRSRALVEGMALAAAATPRPLKLPSAPQGWAQLREHPATREPFAQFDGLVVWAGKAGAAQDTVVIPLSPIQQQRFAAGKTVFVATCAPCHQPSGKGLDGLAPPLCDSEWVLEDPQRLIRVVLHGLAGTVRVLGRAHSGEMPAFGAMDDDQLSSVLTYIRREWGHEASPIDPADVKAVRAATAGRNDAWSSAELSRGDARGDRKSRSAR
jgi:mono/diheme cytochrome c family protein